MVTEPGRLAWTVLITAFVLFCMITAGVFFGVRWFLFDSTIAIETTLSVSRNTVSLLNSGGDSGYQAVRSMTTAFEGQQMATDSSSQGFVTFTDPHQQAVVASLTLHHDSTITLGTATRPRFDFSNGPLIITVEGLSGNIDIDIVPGLTRTIIFDIISEHGRIRLGDAGTYLVNNNSEAFAVFNRQGEAAIINNIPEARSIPNGFQGAISITTNEITVEQPLVDILPDGSFDTFNPANETLSTAWGCYTLRDDPEAVDGIHLRETAFGRSVMHITRVEEIGKSARNHAETGCLQWLNTPETPLPVTQYDYLELRATLQIQDSPLMLSVCGQAGSECPMMIEIDYVDQGGNPQQWYHGFYTRFDQATGNPLRCPSCAQDHEQLNQDTWYTYTSGNLLRLLPPGQKPTAINSVRFYASGHEYNVLLSEVALLAGNTEDTTTNEPASVEPEPTLSATPSPTATMPATEPQPTVPTGQPSPTTAPKETTTLLEETTR